MTKKTFAAHCRALSERFLQTAVVVDDEAFPSEPTVDSGGVVEPTRGQAKPASDDTRSSGSAGHRLDTKAIIDSFAGLGMICGVIGPTQAAMETIRQADVVVLDWRLKDDDREYALKLLKGIVAGESDRNALRLVAFYTGEADLPAIQEAIVETLVDVGLGPEVVDTCAVTYRHGRIVLYAKPSVNLPPALQDRRVSENELPNRLVGDFSNMTAGLLPSIALLSLAAVREGAHMVLDRFCARLDPAFLAHRASLPNPEDAERQMVNHVAEELRGLMDYVVADQAPAGEEAITGWLHDLAVDSPRFQFGQRTLNAEQALTLAIHGLKQSILRNNEFEHLSEGFAGGAAEGLDEELAWIITSRTVINAPRPTLWLGTVVARRPQCNELRPAQLVCLRPRCDSVRLTDKTFFAFLPLGEPVHGQEQIIVKTNDGYERRGISTDASGWQVHAFKPDSNRHSVVAGQNGTDGPFVFVDVYGAEFEWLGELKAEFAQSVAQAFAGTFSRIAVDQSEWLRRSAQK